MGTTKQERLGEIRYNKYNTPMKIIEYKSAKSVTVEFQDEYKFKVNTSYGNFKKGEITNPYDKTVYGYGYVGEGKYNRKDNHNRYEKWSKMIRRCYDPYELNKRPTYINCFVCDEWLNFQNFAKWYEENYYEVKDEIMALDKDILYKNNKIYSPKTCIFVPKRINSLFIRSDASRGEYPIGVSYYYKKDRDWERLMVSCHIYENNRTKNKFLGYFSLDKPFQAFYCYKQFKENYIKQVADEYKDLIPKKLYDAMYKYEVEIND